MVALSHRAEAGPLPYSPDAETLHLWHLDGTNAPAADAGLNAFPLQGLLNGAALGSNAFPGFSTALNTHTGAGDQLGILTLQPFLAADASDNAPAGFTWFGTNGAFTLEALIKLDVLPESAPGSALDILSMEGDSNERVFNFRIEKSAAPNLSFVALPNSGVNTSALTFNSPIPMSGTNALALNTWFHVAVSYDGNPGTTNNLRLYWTRLDSGARQANLLGSHSLPADFGPTLGDFAVGNDARSSFNENEVFPGLIDEVRISSAARAPNEFVFRSMTVFSASSWQDPNVPANTLDGDLNTRWSAQGDGQFITYDLGRTELVSAVKIAVYQGDTRTTRFDVQLSLSNTDWQTVLTNATSSGTTLNLETFAFAETPARYLRLVGHGNSQSDWNSLTEVSVESSVGGDSDHDGLPDDWEYAYFGNLDQTAEGDPDADTLSNLYEYQHDLNPTQFNSQDDLDADGLADAWEQTWFGGLSQNAAGDPDRDGFSNLMEMQNGSSPVNPDSVPGDLDGDSLPDDWELANLGNLNSWAYEDPDGDGYNNVAERTAGTSPTNALSHPAWVSPRVALLGDSVLDTNACLMPNSAPYGRAINGVSFQTKPLLTFGGYQYAAWYDTIGTTQNLWVARRTVSDTSVGAWQKTDTGSDFTNGDEGVWDAHNVVSLGISPIDGTLHMSWDHHGNTLRYRRSVRGLCTTNPAAWGSGMFNAEQNWLVAAGQTVSSVTYPIFLNTPADGLMFEYRTGSTSAGDHWFHTYNPATGNWSARWKFSAKEGSYTGVSASGNTITSTSRNAYENNFDFGLDGTLHYTWTYRETDAANHDIFYACSTDGGITWRNNAGTMIADTTLGQAIRVDSPAIAVKVLDGRQLLINQQAQCVDRAGRVHVLMLHRQPEPGFEWHFGDGAFSTADTAYYHYFRDPVSGEWRQRRLPVDSHSVGSRPKIGFDMDGNVYAVYVAGTTVTVPGYGAGNLVIASASSISDYTDWADVAAVPVSYNGEPLIDQGRLLRDGILSVFIQEDGPSATVAIGTPLHVLDFAVNVPRPDPLSLAFIGSDCVINVESAVGFTYQLQTTDSLSSGAWTNVGSAISGTGGLLALAHVGAAQESQRFYHVIRNP